MSRTKRPSPALVVAVLALVAAVAVPAYALTKKEKKVVKKIARVQAKKQINARAGDFTPAGEVHSPARLVLNDPISGDPISQKGPNLLVAGSFTIQARCSENVNGGDADRAELLVAGPERSSFSGLRTGFGELNNTSTGGGFITVALAGASNGNVVRSGHLTGVAPNGQVLTMSGSAEVNDPAGDCVFGVTAIGP
jgi:hypothetical protein